jgi:hypothetical protein
MVMVEPVQMPCLNEQVVYSEQQVVSISPSTHMVPTFGGLELPLGTSKYPPRSEDTIRDLSERRSTAADMATIPWRVLALEDGLTVQGTEIQLRLGPVWCCRCLRVTLHSIYGAGPSANLTMQRGFKVQVQVQVFTQRPRNGRIKLCHFANREIQLSKLCRISKQGDQASNIYYNMQASHTYRHKAQIR